MGLKVLVVEDEGIARLHIIHTLKQLGHEVVGWAASGEQAIALATQHKPDLIMMDIGLEGEMTGVEAAAEIQANHDVVAIFLSAYTLQELQQNYGLPEGANYIPKPVLIDDLRTYIEQTVRNR